MDMQDTVDRLIAVGRPDLAERLKHLAGKHNQARHGWRFAKGGDDAARLGAARHSLRGRDAGERAEYRKRAGMPEAKHPARSVNSNDGSSGAAIRELRAMGKSESQIAAAQDEARTLIKDNLLKDADWKRSLREELSKESLQDVFGDERGIQLRDMFERAYRKFAEEIANENNRIRDDYALAGKGTMT